MNKPLLCLAIGLASLAATAPASALVAVVADCTTNSQPQVRVVVTNNMGIGKHRTPHYAATVTTDQEQTTVAQYTIFPVPAQAASAAAGSSASANSAEVGWKADLADPKHNAFSLLDKDANAPRRLSFDKNQGTAGGHADFTDLTCRIWSPVK